MSQWKLLRGRRFASLFLTQLAGAFNDNLFKNALVIMITFRAANAQLVALAGGLFILPFFLFSATAGQLADKLSKTKLIRVVKLAEIAVMAVAAYGFVVDDLDLLLGVLFCMGLQSAFFGPAKYSVLPELLAERDLVGGNALVEMGTFVAILAGTIAGGIAIAVDARGPAIVAIAVVIVAIAGFVASLFIPSLPAAAPELEISRDPIRPTLETYRITKANRPVFLSILGISWFWFLGASLITLLPLYAKGELAGDESMVTFMLALFCVGIAAGSLLCERLSHRQLELGLVPFGSIGMSLFLVDLFAIGSTPSVIRASVDLAGLATFGGLFTVPLYTMIQQRSDPATRSRVIAGNNILNAAFMVVASLMLMGLFALGLDIPRIFGVLAILNAAVAVYVYTVIPEFLLRFVAWILANVMYRVRVTGREHIPEHGAAVLVCNHVSFVDWLLVASACPRPVRFVMYHRYANIPLAGFLFRDAKVIPIAPASESETTLDAAYDRIAEELEDGEIVCIFPEGRLTEDGQLGTFKRGIERIVARTPVPVIPMALDGMWGSFFSKAGTKPFARMWSKVSLAITPPLDPQTVEADRLRAVVADSARRVRAGA